MKYDFDPVVIVIVVAVLIIIVIGIFISLANYGECRATNSVRYCYTTHMVR